MHLNGRSKGFPNAEIFPLRWFSICVFGLSTIYKKFRINNFHFINDHIGN